MVLGAEGAVVELAELVGVTELVFVELAELVGVTELVFVELAELVGVTELDVELVGVTELVFALEVDEIEVDWSAVHTAHVSTAKTKNESWSRIAVRVCLPLPHEFNHVIVTC